MLTSLFQCNIKFSISTESKNPKTCRHRKFLICLYVFGFLDSVEIEKVVGRAKKSTHYFPDADCNCTVQRRCSTEDTGKNPSRHLCHNNYVNDIRVNGRGFSSSGTYNLINLY
jgi:hypothetical protein